MNGADALANDPVRGLIVGFPGGGKTGCVSALLNVGYKVRLLNFEGLNYRSLIKFSKPEALPNLDILSFNDQMHMGQKFMEPLGTPTAFTQMLNAMKEWKGKDAKGKEYSLGKPREWGPDTVVVLDGMTGLGEACFRRMMNAQGRVPGTVQQRDWGFAVQDQVEALRLMGLPQNQYHFLVLAHLQMVTPDDIKKDDDEFTKDLKREIGSLISSKMFPKAITRPLSMQIAKEFPMVVQAKQTIVNGKAARWLYTAAGEEVDLKVPFEGAETRYPIETGLAQIFEGYGLTAPGLKTAVGVKKR